MDAEVFGQVNIWNVEGPGGRRRRNFRARPWTAVTSRAAAAMVYRCTMSKQLEGASVGSGSSAQVNYEQTVRGRATSRAAVAVYRCTTSKQRTAGGDSPVVHVYTPSKQSGNAVSRPCLPPRRRTRHGVVVPPRTPDHLAHRQQYHKPNCQGLADIARHFIRRTLNPRLSVAIYDVASLPDIARHVIQRILNSGFSSQMATYDAASNIYNIARPSCYEF